MSICYATLAQAKLELKAPTTDTTDDAILMRNIRQVSARLDNLFQRPYFFAPYTETREFVLMRQMVNSRVNSFTFPGNLLSLTSVTVNSTALVIGTDVETFQLNNINRTPIHALRLLGCCRTWYDFAPTTGDEYAPTAVTIAGVWGMHRYYAQDAWQAADALAAAIVSTTATTLTVADVDGADYLGFTPRISAGNIIRIDSEAMEVTATNTTTNVVTVRRGVLGTTAATHSNGATVEVYYPEEPVQRAVYRQAAFLYARRGAYEGAVATDMGGTITFPQDVLSEIYGIVQGYNN